jgi:PTB domain-containing engulfment adapter protein 1
LDFSQKLFIFHLYQLNSTFDALKPSIGTKLEGLLLNSDSDSDFDPRAEESEITNGHKITNDLFGFEPQKTLGQQLFVNNNNSINNNLLMSNGGSQPTMAPLINGPPTSPPPLCKCNKMTY